MNRQGFVYLLAAALFFSVMTVCVKLAGQIVPAEEIMFVRAGIGLMLSLIAVRRAGLAIGGVSRRLLLLRGVLGSCGLYCFFYAITILPLSEVTTIHYTNPIFTAVLAAVFLGEGISRRLLGGLMISLAGVVVVSRPGFIFGGVGPLDPVAVLVALVGAIFSSGAYVTVRQLRKTDDPILVVLYFPLVATPLFAPAAIHVWTWPGAIGWGILLAMGIATQIAQICLTRGLHRVPAGRGMAVGYVQIVFAILWGKALFGEAIDGRGVVGAVMIVGGALIASWGSETRSQKPTKAQVTP